MMPSGLPTMTATKSAKASGVCKGLMRTHSCCCVRVGWAFKNSATMLRATDVRSGATESSKSKIKASADVLMDLDSFFSLSPGTKSSDLSMFIGLSGVIS